jgi:hypothetical protein
MTVPIRVSSDQHALDPATAAPLFPTRLATGTAISLTGFGSRAQYAVASDGRFLLNATADDAITPPITVVLNWTAALPR